MIASDQPYAVEPVVNGAHRFNYYFAVDTSFPNMRSSFSVEDGQEALIQIGFSVSRLFLTLSTRQTQYIRLTAYINDVDISRYLIQNVQVDWPDESGGSCNFRLISQNPFAESALVDVEGLFDLYASLTDPSTNELVTVRLFKGRIVQYDYNPDTDVADISCQDMSRDVSHDTSRLNREILGVDPVITEKKTCTVNNQLTVSQNIDVDQPTPILGIWAESDTGLSSNFIESGDFLIEPDRRTISFFGSGLIVSGTNYNIRYLIPLSQFNIPQITKGQVIRLIAELAGIDTVRIEREGHSEDEIVGVNITANNELPLDLIRKIVVPQTWKVEYSEAGDLVVRREILKTATDADFTMDESIILEGSLKITKDIDSVINEIRVAGILKRLGNNFSSGQF